MPTTWPGLDELSPVIAVHKDSLLEGIVSRFRPHLLKAWCERLSRAHSAVMSDMAHLFLSSMLRLYALHGTDFWGVIRYCIAYPPTFFKIVIL